jgi:hypothetical protein
MMAVLRRGASSDSSYLHCDLSSLQSGSGLGGPVSLNCVVNATWGGKPPKPNQAQGVMNPDATTLSLRCHFSLAQYDWFYFCDLHTETLRMMTFCLLPDLKGFKHRRTQGRRRKRSPGRLTLSGIAARIRIIIPALAFLPCN